MAQALHGCDGKWLFPFKRQRTTWKSGRRGQQPRRFKSASSSLVSSRAALTPLGLGGLLRSCCRVKMPQFSEAAGQGIHRSSKSCSVPPRAADRAPGVTIRASLQVLPGFRG